MNALAPTTPTLRLIGTEDGGFTQPYFDLSYSRVTRTSSTPASTSDAPDASDAST